MKDLSAEARLVRIQVKIERAKKHFGDFEREAEAFRDAYLHVVGTKTNPKTRQAFQYFAKLPVSKFEVLAIAGDVLHNLRSALDHLAFQLVEVGECRGIGERRGKRIAFPIFDTANDYEALKAGKVKGARKAAIKAIDALQPYKGGKGEILWRLHELDNIDKHRTLFAYSQDCMLVADWLLEYSDSPYNLKRRNPEFAGIDALDSEVEQEMELEIDKAILESQIAKSNAMLPSLIQLVDYVKNLILAFTPFLE